MLRRKLAERMSPIKKGLAIETPILEEIPVRAQVLASLEFPFPRVMGVIPVLVHGKAYGPTAGLWYRVTFPKPITDPSVVCVGEARGGEVPRPTLPTISVRPVEKIAALAKVAKDKIPDLSLPAISINVPRWQMDVPTASDFVKLVKGFFGDWSWLNWARDAIAWAIGSFEYSIWNAIFRPRALERLNNEVLVPIKNSLISARDNINAKITEINDRLEKVRTQINTKLDEIDARFETLRTGANDGLGTLRGNTESSVNGVLATLFPRLYDAWGFPRNMALTSLHIRNVTSSGFEFQSYGVTTAYYIAIGHR